MILIINITSRLEASRLDDNDNQYQWASERRGDWGLVILIVIINKARGQ